MQNQQPTKEHESDQTLDVSIYTDLQKIQGRD